MKILVSAAFVGLVVTGYGADFIVENGEIRPAQTLDTAGNVGLIEAGGEIVTAVAPGVDMQADDQQLTNHGTIRTTDNRGVVNIGDRSWIVNTNLITTTGDGAEGIRNSGSDVVIFQSGTIRTEGEFATGIRHFNGTGTYVANGGLIETIGDTATGISGGGEDSFFVNRGLIVTRGSGSHGMASTEDSNAKLVNTGCIVTEGPSSNGIDYAGVILDSESLASFNDDFRIFNTGTIIAQGPDADGIFDATDNTQVINSGTIVSRQGFAINFGTDPTNPTLTLLRGSNLQGPVQAETLNINVETGLNLALNIQTDNGFNAGVIEAPYAIQGVVNSSDLLGVVDPTGPSMQSDIAADLSDTFLNGIYRYRTAFPCCCNPCGCGGVWIEALGSYRERDPRHYVSYNVRQGGFLVGYNAPFNAGYLNLFAGATFGKAVLDKRTQTTDFNCYVGGVSYERLICDSFIGLALIAGYADLDNHRYVMHNLAPNGVEDAHTNPGGFFITPEIVFAHTLARCWFQPIVSGTIRYAGLFLGSYSETGSVTNLTIKDRDLHLLTIRGELGFPLADRCCSWEVEPYIGGAGRFELGDTRIRGELLGQSLLFQSAVSDKLGYFLAGFRAERSVGCLDLFLNLEANWDNMNSFRTLGEGGIGYVF
ncbi:MAG: hypothetical protein S4CHLAM2_05050 [Chlamydiales bacterium]|nr:hypothetical protein [Chlamydiales bacterium]